MTEADVSQLEGKALRYAFLRAVFPMMIGEEINPLATVLEDGEVVIFKWDESSPIEIQIKNPAEQKVEALLFLQKHSPSFEVADNQSGVYCTVHGVQAHGIDFFEAGMRAYLLFLAKQNEQSL